MRNNKSYWDDYFSRKSDVVIDDYDGWLLSYQNLLTSGSSVLDLGCGSGADIETLKKYGLKVTAADFSKCAIDFVKKNFSEIETSCFDMTQTFPYKNNTFDIIISDLSLHYFSWKDTKGIICEMYRVLKTNGVLIARVHSIKEIEANNFLQLEKNYYIVNEYPRRYFEIGDIEELFKKWQIVNIEEKNIFRYDTEKYVIEFVVTKR